MPKTQGAWIGLAAIVCVVLVALGWFVLIAPQVDEEASVREQESTLVGENDALQQRVAALKADFAQIDTYRAELSATEVKMPTTPQVEAIFDEIDLIASTNGIVLGDITTDPATSLAALPDLATSPAPAPPAGDASAEPTDGATPDAAAAPVESAEAPVWTAGGPDSLVVFPLKVTFVAGIDQVRGFFNGLQASSSRYFLVSNPAITTLDETKVVDGRTGNLEVTASVYAFVYTDVAAKATTDPLAGVAPVAPSTRDPFGAVAAH